MKMRFSELDSEDILKCPVWRFTNNDDDELEIESCQRHRYTELSGLIVGTQVTFADGSVHLALLQNVSLAGATVNDHFLIATIRARGRWFALARYHDVTIDDFGPDALARFVDRSVDEIFPISYDLREVLKSESKNLVGVIRHEPLVRLSEDEIIQMALRQE